MRRQKCNDSNGTERILDKETKESSCGAYTIHTIYMLCICMCAAHKVQKHGSLPQLSVAATPSSIELVSTTESSCDKQAAAVRKDTSPAGRLCTLFLRSAIVFVQCHIFCCFCALLHLNFCAQRRGEQLVLFARIFLQFHFAYIYYLTAMTVRLCICMSVCMCAFIWLSWNIVCTQEKHIVNVVPPAYLCFGTFNNLRNPHARAPPRSYIHLRLAVVCTHVLSVLHHVFFASPAALKHRKTQFVANQWPIG